MHFRKSIELILCLLMVSLLLAQPAIANSASDGRLDSLVGAWKNPRPGAESLKVMFRKNQAGELVAQGDYSGLSYSLTCHPENGSVSCTGSGKMRSDGEAFIYRNNIKLVGNKLIESWRVNLMPSPDDSPVNSGNDELVRETDIRREKDARELMNQGVTETAQPKPGEDERKLLAEPERRQAETRSRQDAVHIAEEQR